MLNASFLTKAIVSGALLQWQKAEEQGTPFPQLHTNDICRQNLWEVIESR